MIVPDNISPEALESLINSGGLAKLSTSDSHIDTVVTDEISIKEKPLEDSPISIPLPKRIEKSASLESVPLSPIEPKVLPNRIDDKASPASITSYPGDIERDSIVTPPDGGFKTIQELFTLDFPNPSFLVSFYNQDIAEGRTTLHKWQVDISEELVPTPKPTAQHPLKYCLVAANGSGKDAFVVAPFAIWFAISKKKARVIVTSSSGTQLTAQTESYIKDLAERVNAFHGEEIFRVRQRFIRCIKSGSEIRLFATDEEGKAEGYHPIEPNAEMAIIVNEGKSVTEDIHKALRRCSGYNYWLEVSSPGEPTGDLYYAFNNWKHTRRVNSFECPHISEEEREEDKQRYGEHSAYYRSKHLALFTTIGGQVIIPLEIVDRLLASPPTLNFTAAKWKKRFGIDLSAGGDELVFTCTLGNRVIEETVWRDRDTTLSADKIHGLLRKHGIPFNYSLIFADDGGIGHSIIDMLVRKGWVNINRIHNQSPAFNRRHFGNRGAESYDRVKRLFEENIWNPVGMSKECIEQLTNRKVKDRLDGAKVYLQSKKEAKAHGFCSPDRADAYILSLTGLTIDDFLEDLDAATKATLKQRPRFTTSEMAEHYDNEVTFGNGLPNISSRSNKKIYGSLARVLNNDSEQEIEFDNVANN